jgi:hypothetical protein
MTAVRGPFTDWTESIMSIFQRIVLLMKVLVLLSLGMSTAWAHNPVPSAAVVTSGQASHLQLAKSEAEPGDQGQGGSEGDDDSTTDEPDSDDADADEGDSQT